MRKKRRILVIIIVLLVVTLIPIKTTLQDGGTVKYNAIVYSITKYNQLNTVDASGNTISGRKDTQIRIFPFNFIDNN